MLIHKMRLDDYMAVLDVNSGAVHLVDEVIYDLLDYYDGNNAEAAMAALTGKYPAEDIKEAMEEMQDLQKTLKWEIRLQYQGEFKVENILNIMNKMEKMKQRLHLLFVL